MKTLSFVLALFLLGTSDMQDQQSKKDPVDTAFFEIDELCDQREQSGRTYLPFFRNTDLNTGIYHLQAGARDGQSPHPEDEVYHVLSGKAMLMAGEEDQEVSAGSVIFVAKGIAHRFHDIEEDLTVLVFFASGKK